MAKFCNESYEPRVTSLLNDIFYAQDISNEGRLLLLRVYTEIMVRKLLNKKETDSLTLYAAVENEIVNLPYADFIKDSIHHIREIGNRYGHTKYLEPATDDDVQESLDCLTKILSYFFIAFFTKHEFGSNLEIVRKFSLLPPFIRLKVLEFLFNQYPTNIEIIDRYCLAILKQDGIEKAKEWLNKNRQYLETLSCCTEKGLSDISQKYGSEIAEVIKDSAPNNMYICCYDKINALAPELPSEGSLYRTIEEALLYFEAHKEYSISSDATNEFNDLMSFVYMGRKSAHTLS